MISSKTIFLLFNFVGLQITWAACAYGASHGSPSLGVYVGFTYIVLHFLFTKTRHVDLLVFVGIGLLGILVDTMNTYFGVVSFNNSTTSPLSIPYWLITLWLVFTLMIPHSLYWLADYKKISMLAGALGGSFSYWLGHKLGALQLLEPLQYSVGVYFIEWGLLFPLGLILTQYLFNNRKTKSDYP